MKIAILNTYDTLGGAARAMYRLHKGLRKIGQESKILCRFKHSSDSFAIPIEESFDPKFSNSEDSHFHQVIQYYINQNRTDLTNTIFSHPYPGWDVSNHPLIQEADIINLHWVAYFLSPTSIASLLQLGKPIVWTLHDEWAFTGGCHYTAGCEGFLKDCKNCPQILTENSLIPYSNLTDKLQLFQNEITIVTPSNWLAKQVKKSKLFQNSRIEVISNSLETEVFIPTAKEKAKEAWKIPKESFTLLFGAESGKERRKGFHLLVEALNLLNENPIWKEAKDNGKLHILLFGNPAEEIKNLNLPYTSVGYISDDEKLAFVYSAADLFVLPSLEDNLPNTMLESLCCETPVVTFACGGMMDIIKEKETGYLAEFASPTSLAHKILQAYKNPQERIQYGEKGKNWMQQEFSLDMQAQKYTKLFQELLSKHSGKGEGSLKTFSFLGDETYKNLQRIQKEAESFFSRQTFQIVFEFLQTQSQLQKTQSELHQTQLQLHQGLSISQLFCKEEDSYDFSKNITLSSSTSLEWEKFSLNYDLSLWKNPITEILWMPMWRSSCAIRIHEISIQESEQIFPLQPKIEGNYTKMEENTYFYYNHHPLMSFTVKLEKHERLILKGEWKVISTWDSYLAMEEEIQKRLKEIYESKTYKLGKFLLKGIKFFQR